MPSSEWQEKKKIVYEWEELNICESPGQELERRIKFE